MARGRKTGGRVLGTRNKASEEIVQWARAVLEDPEYRQNLAARLRAGKVAPAVETALYYYAYGRPVERIEHSGSLGIRPEDMDQMSDAQLLALIAHRQPSPYEVAQA